MSKVKINIKDWTEFAKEQPLNGVEISVIDNEGFMSVGEIQFGKFFGYTCDCNGYHKIIMSKSLIKYWKKL